MTKPQELTSREWTLLEQALRIAREGESIGEFATPAELENLVDKINAHRRAHANPG